MSTTTVTRYIDARRERVYRTLLDPRAVATWMVPEGMSSRVHAFDARVGGYFRISLTYNDTTETGKTTAHTDTFHGRFVELVPNERLVQKLEFETSRPEMQGEMTITISLSDSDGGTELVAVHDGLPPGVPLEDNVTGWEMSLANLADLIEKEA